MTRPTYGDLPACQLTAATAFVTRLAFTHLPQASDERGGTLAIKVQEACRIRRHGLDSQARHAAHHRTRGS